MARFVLESINIAFMLSAIRRSPSSVACWYRITA